jgi:hypothetical protein
MRPFKRRTPLERKQARIEGEYMRQAAADARPAPVPDTNRAPCEKHNRDFTPEPGPRGQTRPPVGLCRECLKEQALVRQGKRLGDEVQAPPFVYVTPAPWRAATKRENEAWENYLITHKDELEAAGALHLVDRIRYDAAIARADRVRELELAELRDTPAARRARHRKWWGRHVSRYV